MTAASAAPSGQVRFADGVTVRLVAASRDVETGQGPGMFPGRPFTVIEIEVVNGGPRPLTLDRVVVTAMSGKPPTVVAPVYAGRQAVRDFSGTLAPGRAARARYGFAIAPAATGAVTLAVDLDDAHHPATFSGALNVRS